MAYGGIHETQNDPGLLWESVYTRLGRSQTRLDRSQFAFERLHSDRSGLRSISDRSNHLFVWTVRNDSQTQLNLWELC